MEKTLAQRFDELFDGLRKAHGRYSGIGDPIAEKGGKREGRIRQTIHEPITVALWQKHLDGVDGLGVIPIRADSTSVFGCVDVDDYTSTDHEGIARRVMNLKLPLVLTRSKSGGTHLWLFSKEPVAAAKMVARLKEIASLLGYGTSEIFPKQVEFADNPKDCGSWVNMPYFHGMMGGRYAVVINGAGESMGLDEEQFLRYVPTIAQEPAYFDTPVHVSVEIPQGPPCLQNLVQIGFPQGTRNKGLYNLAIYAKKVDPDNYASLIEDYNRRYMVPPLGSDEVTSIIKSVGKKEYRYTCSDQPLVQFCNSAVCRGRKFGIGAAGANLPEFGRLRKLLTDPPMWFWDVNGRPLELETEDLQDPKQFQKVCMNRLNMMPSIPKREVWEQLVATAMADIDEIEVPENTSKKGQFIEFLEKFCTGRAQGQRKEDLLRGVPWTDAGRTYISLTALRQYLDRERFKELKQNEIINVLREMNGTALEICLKGVTRNYWSIPAFAAQVEGHDLPDALKEEEKPF